MNGMLPELLAFGAAVMSALFLFSGTTTFILTGIVYILLKMEQNNENVKG